MAKHVNIILITCMWQLCMYAAPVLGLRRAEFNCKREVSWNCTLGKRILDCQSFNIPLTRALKTSPEILKYQIQDLVNSTCSFYHRRKRLKGWFNCDITTRTNLEASDFNYFCPCQCILWSAKTEIVRRAVTDNSVLDAEKNLTINAYPIPERKSVKIVMNVDSNYSLKYFISLQQMRSNYQRDGNEIYQEEQPRETSLINNMTQEIVLTIPNLQPGNYCVLFCRRVKEMPMCRNQTFFLESNTSLGYIRKRQSNFDQWFIFGLVAAVVMIVIVGIVIFYYKIKSKNSAPKKKKVLKYDSFPNCVLKKKRRILLIYCALNEDHRQRVKALSDVLEKCFVCDVIADWKNQNESVTNTVGWLDYEMTNCDKIIIVNCQAAYILQSVYLQRIHETDLKLPESLPAVFSVFEFFLPAIHTKISVQPGEYLPKIINIRFPNTSTNFTLDFIKSENCLAIPLQFRELLIKIYDLSNQCYKDETIDSLWKNETLYKQFCASLGYVDEQEPPSPSDNRSESSTTTLITPNNLTTSYQFLSVV